jgi:hypothetical protein
MAKAKVKIDVYTSLNIPGKIQYARDRVDDMTGNANFTTPSPALLLVTNAAQDLEDKYQAAQGGGQAQTAAMYASEAALDDLMRREAAYVDTVAQGNVVVITSGGWTPTKTEKVPLQAPDKVEGLTLKQSPQSGTFTSSSNPVENAKGFVTIISQMENPPITIDGEEFIVGNSVTPIIIHTGGGRKATHTGLTPGTKYYVRKFAFNTAGRGPDSDVISIMVV